MKADADRPCTAFFGMRRIAAGALSAVVAAAKAVVDRGEGPEPAIFDDATGRPIEVDFRGTLADVRSRLARSPAAEEAEARGARGPGRPRLGVVAREVTLLPRHWDWLNQQPGGASVALRKLVDGARRVNEGRDRVRAAQEAANRFMTAIAGDLPQFEEATRALFAGDRSRFEASTEAWPADVRDHSLKLATPAFVPEAAEQE